MKRKYRIDRIIICLVILSLLIFLITLLINKLTNKEEYSIKYNINNIKVIEQYNNNTKSYYYNLTYNSLSYDFIYSLERQEDKKLINGIKKYNDSNETCLVVESNYFNINPLCSKEDELIDYHLVNTNLQSKLSKYYNGTISEEIELNNYTIYNNEDTYVLWNFNSINYIKNNKLSTIKIFKKDFYDVSISALVNNYFIVADYNQEYSFTKFYLVDLSTKEVSTWDTKTNISFDSYILGTKDKSIYLIDQKNKVEYEIVPHKKKMRIVSKSNKGILYNNGIEEKISMNQLVSKNHTFNNSIYNYTLINKKLYLYYKNTDIKYLVSNNEIDKIVYQKEDNVYYLIGTTLYRYNLKYGELKLMTYSEWKYNNNNVIFIQ